MSSKLNRDTNSSNHSLNKLATNSRSLLMSKANSTDMYDTFNDDSLPSGPTNRERRPSRSSVDNVALSSIRPMKFQQGPSSINNISSSHHDVGFSYIKIAFVVVLFLLSLIAFVCQTEFTAYLYSDLKFDEPLLLLLITHGSWWIFWPLQFTSIGCYKAFKKWIKFRKGYEDPNGKVWKGFRNAFASSVKTQHKNIFHSAELTAKLNIEGFENEFGKHSFKYYSQFFNSVAIKYIMKSCLWLSIILNVAGTTWYVAMAFSTGSDVTAIYNSSAFTAYLFAIPILGEKFSWIKMSSVVIAVLGVVVVAYSGKGVNPEDYPHRMLGNFIILIGAILYGLYEVVYKKMCCPPSGEVSARRQATFSNFSMCCIGVSTLFTLTAAMAVVHISGLHKFVIPTDPKQWQYIILSSLSNLTFSLSFLALMALTSPVLSSVASLVTILIVGVVEWLLWDIKISIKQLLGYLFIIIGFGLLTYASWNEITEEDKDDELIDTDTESVMSVASGSMNAV